MQGKIYYNNADASLKNYRSAAWTFLYFDIDEVQLMLGGCIFNRVNGNNLQYKIKGDNKS